LARPRKTGLDYFPHDVDAIEDEKIEALRALYGNDGYAFYFILLERIYRSNNAELNVSKKAILAALVKKIGVSEQKFYEMLETALELELFDKEAFEGNQILTSNGVKKRYIEVQNMRERWRKQKEKNKKECDTSSVFHAENTEENTEDNAEVTGESKEKKRKEKIYIRSSSCCTSLGKVFQFYEENIGLISSYQAQSLNSYLDDGLSPELVIEAMKDSLGSDNKWKYLTAILNNCIEQKVYTLEQYNAAKTEHENRKNKDPTKGQKIKTWVELKEEKYQNTKMAVLEKLKKEGVLTDEG